MAAYKYDMTHNRRGKCVIINNMKFLPGTKQSYRTGSDVDARNMISLFQGLGFEVTLKENQTSEEMFQCALDIKKYKHTDADCFAMVILSHGEEFGEIWGVDEKILLEHIFQPIRNCESLCGKPKLFFIQACKGKELDDGAEIPVEYEADGVNESRKAPKQSIPLQADFLYAYNTPPDHYSFRNTENGAWFIRAIHKVFTEHARTMEIMQMMTRVNHMVAYEFTNKYRGQYKKQVSSHVSMLTKELYLVPKPAPTAAK